MSVDNIHLIKVLPVKKSIALLLKYEFVRSHFHDKKSDTQFAESTSTEILYNTILK